MMVELPAKVCFTHVTPLVVICYLVYWIISTFQIIILMCSYIHSKLRKNKSSHSLHTFIFIFILITRLLVFPSSCSDDGVFWQLWYYNIWKTYIKYAFIVVWGFSRCWCCFGFGLCWLSKCTEKHCFEYTMNATYCLLKYSEMSRITRKRICMKRSFSWIVKQKREGAGGTGFVHCA